MYLPDSAPNQSKALELLTAAADNPAERCLDDPEVKEAFDQSLRELAEDIIQFHPGLAHLLVSMSGEPCPVINGQN